MKPVRVLVVSPGRDLTLFLGRALDPKRFQVVDVEPGPGFVDAVRRERPHIAVVDRIDERLQAAQLEIALLKDRCPDVQVIAVSGRSSESDARVVEQGIFYYLTSPTAKELPRLVEAAAAARKTRGAAGAPPT
ncbi:MAG: hypothetical protein HY704_02085 [Gemmatimonadetes bacterium]|nr:hypothetical protein [Gemmatimonadota bacterium]